ncbi:MAG: sigma-70 family RNA polymerase sigma factor [Planctomycetaceae bacterium]|nr:sigma-70 family RNA polymerase sigma factor [Planctomycetales bacterium]MCB9872885.1 sigma-70 family RNA polymerase sigma factor [Planctomycetaceae bacterium]MCB9941493.1 sigma-70 family RNA polymerase sigma factor [Planctomycetaceae bacterium]HRX81002.1 sigma-70 family RNA polymerase sigma factor [Pirellulaceae bacterium]
MSLSDIDRDLLQRCLSNGPRAWEDFVDRFLGLVVHVINHTSQSRSIRLTAQDREDLSADVMLAIVSDDFAVLRRFRGDSSLATYLTVIARRVVVRELLKRKTSSPSLSNVIDRTNPKNRVPLSEERINNRDEVEQLLRSLHGPEADVIRMYHLEGKTYQEISSSVGMPENSIGPTLSRARAKMREAGTE